MQERGGAPPPVLPSGTVTFLFTDIEGSTRRWERYGPAMGRCVARHDELLGLAVSSAGGVVVKHTGDGIMAAFSHADAALSAALDGQSRLTAQDWSPVPALRVRMGIHQGRAEPLGADYFGVAVNRAARVADAGHGGQVLVSAAAAATMTMPRGVQLRSRGSHQLKDLAEPIELYQVLGGGLEAELLALRTIDPAKYRLPAQHTPFFGRAAELRQARLGLDEGRLLTLCGPGGVGKTRLAVQVAADLVGERADGARFVDLSHARQGESLERLFCEQLGVAAAASAGAVSQSQRDALARHLGRQELLVVLDNCEQVADQAAEIAGWLIDAIPGLQLLCTSREPLRIAGEQVIRVEPFEIGPNGSSEVSDPAIELFLDRARAAGAPTPDREQLAAIASICRLVDRLPLGIELAAARTGTMALDELARRIEEHHGVLSSRQRDRTQRHRTIDELLDWSFTLLEGDEQRLLARLSVFAAPAELAAIEAVCGDPPAVHTGTGTSTDLVDLLTSLVDRSLVVHDGQSGCYRLLSLVRRFARQQLDQAEDRAMLLARYRRWCASLHDELDDDERLRRVAASRFHEVANGLDDAVTAGDAVAVWAIASWFWRVYEMTGRVEVGIATLQRALRLGPTGSASDPPTRRQAEWYARSCNGLAGLLVAVGDATRAIALHEEAAAVSAKADDSNGVGWALVGRSMALLRCEPLDLDQAASWAEAAIVHFATTGERRGHGHARSALGLIAARRGQLDRAEAEYLAALSELRLGRHRRDAAAVLTNLGNLAHDRRQYLRAARFFDGARQLSLELGDLRSSAFIVNNLVLVAQARGDLVHAAGFAREALDLFEQADDLQGAAVAWLHLANVSAQGNERPAALHAYREAIEAFRRCGDARGVLTGLTNLSRVAWAWDARSLAWRCEVDRAAVSLRLNLPRSLADAVETLAERAAELGDVELATRLRRSLARAGESADRDDGAHRAATSDAVALESVLAEARLAGPSEAPLDAEAVGVAGGVAGGAADEATSLMAPALLEQLTSRERELLRLLGEGRSNEELAAALYISKRTVDAHLSHIRTKLGVSDRVKLAVLAQRHLGDTNAR